GPPPAPRRRHTAAPAHARSLCAPPSPGRAGSSGPATAAAAAPHASPGGSARPGPTSRTPDAAPAAHTGPDLAPTSSEKEDHLKCETFYRNPAGNQSRPAKPGQQPEASLAWWRATVPAKRRQ